MTILWRMHQWMKVASNRLAPSQHARRRCTALHRTALHCTHHQPAELQRGGHVGLGRQGVAQRAQRAAPNLQTQNDSTVPGIAQDCTVRLAPAEPVRTAQFSSCFVLCVMSS